MSGLATVLYANNDEMKGREPVWSHHNIRRSRFELIRIRTGACFTVHPADV